MANRLLTGKKFYAHISGFNCCNKQFKTRVNVYMLSNLPIGIPNRLFEYQASGKF